MTRETRVTNQIVFRPPLNKLDSSPVIRKNLGDGVDASIDEKSLSQNSFVSKENRQTKKQAKATDAFVSTLLSSGRLAILSSSASFEEVEAIFNAYYFRVHIVNDKATNTLKGRFLVTKDKVPHPDDNQQEKINLTKVFSSPRRGIRAVLHGDCGLFQYVEFLAGKKDFSLRNELANKAPLNTKGNERIRLAWLKKAMQGKDVFHKERLEGKRLVEKLAETHENNVNLGDDRKTLPTNIVQGEFFGSNFPVSPPQVNAPKALFLHSFAGIDAACKDLKDYNKCKLKKETIIKYYNEHPELRFENVSLYIDSLEKEKQKLKAKLRVFLKSYPEYSDTFKMHTVKGKEQPEIEHPKPEGQSKFTEETKENFRKWYDKRYGPICTKKGYQDAKLVFTALRGDKKNGKGDLTAPHVTLSLGANQPVDALASHHAMGLDGEVRRVFHENHSAQMAVKNKIDKYLRDPDIKRKSYFQRGSEIVAIISSMYQQATNKPLSSGDIIRLNQIVGQYYYATAQLLSSDYVANNECNSNTLPDLTHDCTYDVSKLLSVIPTATLRLTTPDDSNMEITYGKGAYFQVLSQLPASDVAEVQVEQRRQNGTSPDGQNKSCVNAHRSVKVMPQTCYALANEHNLKTIGVPADPRCGAALASNSRVMAFPKLTGRAVWDAVGSPGECNAVFNAPSALGGMYPHLEGITNEFVLSSPTANIGLGCTANDMVPELSNAFRNGGIVSGHILKGHAGCIIGVATITDKDGKTRVGVIYKEPRDVQPYTKSHIKFYPGSTVLESNEVLSTLSYSAPLIKLEFKSGKEAFDQLLAEQRVKKDEDQRVISYCYTSESSGKPVPCLDNENFEKMQKQQLESQGYKYDSKIHAIQPTIAHSSSRKKTVAAQAARSAPKQ